MQNQPIMKQQTLCLLLLCLSFFLLSAEGGCNARQPQSDKKSISQSAKDTSNMKILGINLFGGDYSASWKKVEEAENNGLTEDARKLVQAIYQKAKEDKNDPQIVKTILYLCKYNSYIEENSETKSRQLLLDEIKQAQTPLKNVLQSILADMYWQYFNSNRYDILRRSDATALKQDDFLTWDATYFTQEITALHLAALQDPQALQKMPIKDWNDILNQPQEKLGRTYRPTLYDFLAHRALDYFMNDQANISKAADQFQITDAYAFANAKTFAQKEISTSDPLSVRFYAVKILQDLTNFHLNDPQPDPLIDVELKRLKFAQEKSTLPDRKDQYLKALEALRNQYRDAPATAFVAYEIALWYYNRGNQYNPEQKDQLYKGDRGKAEQVCMECVRAYAGTSGVKNCEALLTQIRQKELSFQTEQTNAPNLPFRALLTYRSVEKVYCRTAKVDEAILKKINAADQEEERINILSNLPTSQQWSVELPKDPDFNTHRAEIKIPAHDLGKYVLIVSANEKFSTNDNAFCYQYTDITNLSLIIRNENAQTLYYVLHRQTGQPIAGVNYKVSLQQWDYQSRQYQDKLIESGKTDKDGSFILKNKPNEYGQLRIDLSKDKDYFSHGDYLRGRYNTDRQPNNYLHFFTDRSIYRPGQTVYFKAIFLETDGKTSKILPNKPLSVILKDVNWQDVATLNLQTNEYGSINGKFTLPTNLLNGTMHLHSDFGQVDIQVEEYKRPKFSVSFEPPKGSFRLNEEITLTGNARAYAGNNIDNATLAYRVVRKANYPDWWWWWWRMPQPTTGEMEITNGKATTDANGNFTITFKALPDPTIDATTRPQYNYEVIADVTDLNGETRTGTTNVVVGYTALVLDLNLPDDLDKREKTSFAISSDNLSGQHEPTAIQLTAYELEQPKRLLRPRLWEKPDKYTMTEREYNEAFPNDIYADEDDPINWAKKQKVLDRALNTAKDTLLDFSYLSDLKPGKYLFAMTAQDKYGEKVEWKKIVTVFDPQSDNMPGHQLWWTYIGPEKILEPGSSANIAYGTSAKDAYILLEIIQEYKVIRREWLRADEDIHTTTQKITEDMRGGFSIGLYMVRLNRFHTTVDNISVPWTNKELNVETTTFRSTLYPGQKEQWQIKISGPKKEKIAAEMVATMFDASLDAFVPHHWYFNIYPAYGNSIGTITYDNGFNIAQAQVYAYNWNKEGSPNYYFDYDQLNWYGFQFGAGYYSRGGAMPMMLSSKSVGGSRQVKRSAAMATEGAMAPPPPAAPPGGEMQQEKDAMAVRTADAAPEESSNAQQDDKKNKTGNKGDFGDVKIRKNLQELAFFMPDLRTDAEGNITLNFTAPEALTKWRLMAFGHTKDLICGHLGKEIVTQKDLMVIPNMPRFLRENDEIYLSAKISNISDKLQQGSAVLELFDALTMQPIDAQFGNKEAVKLFTAQAKQSFPLEWKIKVPDNVSAVVCRMIAKAGNLSDGEENALPVLTNRMLVTESLPLPVRGNSSKKFTFDNLSKAGKSNTLKQHSYTLEFTSNPSWYAVQALPYMMEYPYECTEQIFSRYYANSIATHIANSSPNIKKVFDTWREEAAATATIPGKDAAGALLSNLEKNQELKQLLLEETPWVLDAKSEADRKSRVGLLFDLQKMTQEQEHALDELLKRQTPGGGWTWFPGMPDDRYITQHIICGMGHLDKLGIKQVRNQDQVWSMVQKAVQYLDYEMQRDYDNLLRYKTNLNQENIGYTQLQYLYMRSFFTDIPISSDHRTAFDYWKNQADKYWLKKGTYMQAMIALSLFRHNNGDSKTANDIIKSLRQNTVKNEEMGWYFKDNTGGWYWYQAPIETQALVIEAFDEVANDREAVNELRIWLLKQKQTQDWKTTKATAEACYALLLKGSNWLANQDIVDVVVGKYKVNPKDMPQLKLEAGTGYYKTRWQPEDISADMGNISVTKHDDGIAWGAVYWQYFEQLDKITPAETPLTINKQLFKEITTKNGLKLEPLANGAKLKVGDMVKVRVEVRVDRDMEYVHLKDMRAAGFEPTNVISQYKYQDGLGYYESTKDAATNFFMSWVPKGTYVFEYPLRVSHKGNFSNGITTMQCMYAPEFSSHSEGIRVTVE